MSRHQRGQRRIRDWSRVRVLCIGFLFALMWASLLTRAGYLQITKGPELAEKALRQHLATETDRGMRGEIFDRNGVLLAKSVAVTAVAASPKEIQEHDGPEAVAAQLAPILGVSRDELVKKLSGHGSFLYLARRIGDKAAANIEALRIKGITLLPEWGRSYPNWHLAGQLLGFVGADGQGLEGLEKSFDPVLAGKKANYVVSRDAAGRRLFLDSQGLEMGDTRGKDVRLTIDANVQFFAEEALARAVRDNHGKSGTCLVVHVPTAEILAWANYPFFNPNHGGLAEPKASRNHAALDVLEPGSTVKPLLVAAALQENVVTPDKRYFCERGKWNIYGFNIRDDKHAYDWLPVNLIVRFSSNIGAAKIGQDLGVKKIHAYYDRMGFGDRMGLPLPGEARGTLRPLKDWAKIDAITAAFGQSIGVTPAQLVQAFYALANGGVIKPLKLVTDPTQDANVQLREARIFDEKVALTVQGMMREVVEEEKGTGSKAHIDGLEVGGKTGTAQKAARGGYSNKHLGSFIGFVPAMQPEYIISVMVDEPEPIHYGGVVAAPAVREVALKTLAYQGKLPESVLLAEEAKDSLSARQAATAAGMPVPEPKTQAKSSPKETPEAHRKNKDDGSATQALSQAVAAVNDGRIPNVVGMPLRQAVECLALRGVIPTIQGTGPTVRSQTPAPGSAWGAEEHADVTLVLSPAS